VGVLGVVIGVMAGQLCGAFIYQRINTRPGRKIIASVAAGLVTVLCASPVFIAFSVHRWLAGPEASWGASVFLAVCFGICQGVLFKDRPLRGLRSAGRESSGVPGA
jgi:hypothetical protein